METIIWTLPTTQSSGSIVSKFFETTGAIGTIIWKPGLSFGFFIACQAQAKNQFKVADVLFLKGSDTGQQNTVSCVQQRISAVPPFLSL